MTDGQRWYLSYAVRAAVIVMIFVAWCAVLKWHGSESRQAGFDDAVEQFLSRGIVRKTPAEPVLIPIHSGYAIRLWTAPMSSGEFRAELHRQGEFCGWAVIDFHTDELAEDRD